MKIILASASPRRRQLLALTGLDFSIYESNADESCDFTVFPDALSVGLALRKAREAAKHAEYDDLIIAADTIVYANGEIYGKPTDENDAYRMISSLSASTHSVYTGFAVLQGDKLVLDYDVTDVKFGYMSKNDIESYVASNDWCGKAGGYGIQGNAGIFIERIEGNYQNVVGLPLYKLCRCLYDSFGISTKLK